MASLLKIDFKRLGHRRTVDYAQFEGKWFLNRVAYRQKISYKQPKKDLDLLLDLDIDLQVTLIDKNAIARISKDKIWRRNQLVSRLPQDFDPNFWGERNHVKPSSEISDLIEEMHNLSGNEPSQPVQGWNVQRQDIMRAAQADEVMILKPFGTGQWKDVENAGFVYQELIDDFDLAAHVRVRKASNPEELPDKGFQLGGLMVRDPSSTLEENYIQIGIGNRGSSDIKFFKQMTRKAKSRSKVTKYEGGDVWLRATRNTLSIIRTIFQTRSIKLTGSGRTRTRTY